MFRPKVLRRAGALALLLAGVSAAAIALPGENVRAGAAESRSAAAVGEGRKVVVFGIGGLSWADIRAARQPVFEQMIEAGAAGNVSVRVSNRPGDAYLSLGAGRRAEGGLAAGLAMNADERTGGDSAGGIFRRIPGKQAGSGIVVLPIESIIRRNTDARWSAEPGLLADKLGERGLSTAAVGNADTALGPLAIDPSAAREGSDGAASTGIHREIALAAMDGEGRVPAGNVGRGLLQPDPMAPFGIATSVPAITGAFREAILRADAVFVETGDSARADLASLNLRPGPGAALRRNAVALVDRQISAMLAEVDRGSTLVIIVAPTTPGGPARRGQLRPVLISGPGFGPGVLESPGTRRRGLVTMQDLTATAANFLGISESSFGSGRVVRSVEGAGSTGSLIDMNSKTATSDILRTPFSFALITLDALIFFLGLWQLRKGSLPGWLRFLLILGLTFPLLSHLTGTPVWMLGPRGAAAVVVLAGLLVAAVLQGLQRVAGIPAIAVVPAATVAFFLIDLLTGAQVQLDSVFGYTSVSGGRYYGLGNLGFAIFASCSVLAAGSLAERWPRSGRWFALALLGVVVLWIGHPDLGADVGGTLAMALTATVFGMGLFNRSFSRRTVPMLVGAAVVAGAVFAGLDLSRSATERTHFGDFVSGFVQDPEATWLVLRRKAESSLTFGLVPWGLLVPVAALVIGALRRQSHIWTVLVQRRPAFQTTFRALMVAAVAGSLLNDSGVVVGGMVLALAVPWALLSAADSGAWAGTKPAADDSRDETAKQVPALPRPV